jgi:hypothetical protein
MLWLEACIPRLVGDRQLVCLLLCWSSKQDLLSMRGVDISSQQNKQKQQNNNKNLRHDHRWQCACLWRTATYECHEFFSRERMKNYSHRQTDKQKESSIEAAHCLKSVYTILGENAVAHLAFRIGATLEHFCHFSTDRVYIVLSFFTLADTGQWFLCGTTKHIPACRSRLVSLQM